MEGEVTSQLNVKKVIIVTPDIDRSTFSIPKNYSPDTEKKELLNVITSLVEFTAEQSRSVSNNIITRLSDI